MASICITTRVKATQLNSDFYLYLPKPFVLLSFTLTHMRSPLHNHEDHPSPLLHTGALSVSHHPPLLVEDLFSSSCLRKSAETLL